MALGWAKVAVSVTIPAISAVASAPSAASSGTPSRIASSATISQVAAASGSTQSPVPWAALDAWWSMTIRGTSRNSSGWRIATAPTRSAVAQSESTSRS